VTTSDFDNLRSDATDPREVTLAQIWLLVRAQWIVAVSAVVLSLAMGLYIAFVVPPQYRFTTVLEIGSLPVGEEIVPIEDVDTAAAKLNSGYIPAAIIQFAQEHPSGPGHYPLTAMASEQGQIVTLTSDAPKKDGSLYETLHNRVADRLIADHDRTSLSLRENAKSLIAEAEQRRAGIEADEASAKSKLELLNAAISGNEQRSAELAQRLGQLDNRLAALNGRADSASATQSLLMSQQVSELMSLRSSLNEAGFEYRMRRADLQAARTKLGQEKITATASVKSKEAELAGIRGTRVVGGSAITSMSPVGPGKAVVILAALIVGAAIGIALILALDFFKRAEGLVRRSF